MGAVFIWCYNEDINKENKKENDMDVGLPANVRKVIYVIVVLGTAVLVPLNLGGVVSDLVFAVWTSVAGAASGLAALNTPKA